MRHAIPGPDEVVAMRFDEEAIVAELAAWCGGVVLEEVDPLDPAAVVHTISVPTTDGPVRAALGDWIVRRGEGRYEVQSHEDFVATHVPADDA